jgi:IS5 family transposase
MYDTKTHSCTHRIVSIFQPHVRPIPRCKTKAQIEFGSKLGVSLDKGFARINTFSWGAYREGGDLIKQVEAYKELHGYYPEQVQVDKIYAIRENRMWLAARDIRITFVPLERRKGKEAETYYQKRKRRNEAAERNYIEGKFV